MNLDLDFNLNELDKTLLNKIIDQNVDSIYSSPQARRERTRDEIKKAVWIGIPCEVFLLQYHNCIENDHRYGDVISETGHAIECKASERPWTFGMKKDMIFKIQKYNPANYIMFWFKDGDEYKFNGMEVLNETI